MGETPARNVRIPDDLWSALKVRADAEHTTRTALIIRAVREFLAR